MKKNNLLALGASVLLVLPPVVITVLSTQDVLSSKRETNNNNMSSPLMKEKTSNRTETIQSEETLSSNRQIQFAPSSNSNQTRTLAAEVARFTISKATKDTKLKNTTVARELSELKVSHRLVRLDEIATDFPEASKGFKLVVNSATIDTATPATVNVSISVIQRSDKTSQNATFKITGLTVETPQNEMQRLSDTLLINKEVKKGKKKESSTVAAAAINTSTLDIYYDAVYLGKEISYIVRDATASGDKVVVGLTISSTTTGVTAIQKNIEILNFTTPLKAEAARFDIALEANIPGITTLEAIKEINDAKTKETRIDAIDDIARGFPYTSTQGFSFEIGEAIESHRDLETSEENTVIIPSSIEIPVTITQLSDRTTLKVSTLIKGLFPENKTQEFERIVDTNLVDKRVPAQFQELSSLATISKITDDNSLDLYYPRVEMGDGITYKFKSATASFVHRRIDVIVTVTKSGFKPIEKKISITNFAEPTPSEVQANFYQASAPSKDGTIRATTLARRFNEMEGGTGAKFALIKSLVTNIQDLDKNFTMEIGVVKVDPNLPTSIMIPITITNTEPASKHDVPVTVIYRIGFLLLETPQQELERLSNEVLVNITIEGDKAKETALVAASTITDKSLDTYYPRLAIAKEISYTLESASAIGNALHLVLKVTGADDTKPFYKNVVIDGFKNPTTDLELEALRYGVTKTTEVEGQTNVVIRNLNATSTVEAKITIIKSFIPDFPTVGNAFTLTIGTAKQGINDNSLVEIPITINRKTVTGNELRSISVTFVIKGLKYESPQDELIRIVNEKFGTKRVTNDKRFETAIEASKNITSREALDNYIGIVSLEPGITYEFHSSQAINIANVGNHPSGRVRVGIKVTGRAGTTPIYKTFDISGFADSTTEIELEAIKYAVKLKAKDKTLSTSAIVNKINVEEEDKLSVLKGLVTKFPTESDQYLLTINEASIDFYEPKYANISITINSITHPNSTETIIFTIEGLAS